ncbi:hypothetical protein [Aeromonas hydrophila]|uniref:hypothetical protein n=1 Tax=Aeromonas hydrophila TaxID=644 RepID=UPI0036DA74D0
MRTANPHNIRDDFLAGLQDIETALTDITGKGITQKSRLHVVEYSFLAASILLEGFISDLFVAYINKKNAPFVAYVTTRMTIEATDEVSKRAIPFAAVDIGSHLTLEKIRQILDPRDWNVSFATSADLKAKAGQWLDIPFKIHFTSLSTSHDALLEATKAVRNYLAHRSGASQTAMQAALAHNNLAAGFRRASNNVKSVGSFLDSTPPGGRQTRLKFYLDELQAIAQQLCP